MVLEEVALGVECRRSGYGFRQCAAEGSKGWSVLTDLGGFVAAHRRRGGLGGGVAHVEISEGDLKAVRELDLSVRPGAVGAEIGQFEVGVFKGLKVGIADVEDARPLALKDGGVVVLQMKTRVIAENIRLGNRAVGIDVVAIDQGGEIVPSQPLERGAAKFFSEIELGESRPAHRRAFVVVYLPFRRRGVVIEPAEIGIGRAEERVGADRKGVVHVDIDGRKALGNEAIPLPSLFGVA